MLGACGEDRACRLCLVLPTAAWEAGGRENHGHCLRSNWAYTVQSQSLRSRMVDGWSHILVKRNLKSVPRHRKPGRRRGWGVRPGMGEVLRGAFWVKHGCCTQEFTAAQDSAWIKEGSQGCINAEGLLVEEQEVCYDFVPSSYDREVTSMKSQQHGCLNMV